MERFLNRYAENRLHVGLNDLLALGRIQPDDANELFNMAYLAIRGSGAINGVSALHGVVSRRIFQGLFPRWPEADVPVGHVTNGVHTPTWAAADRLWTEACGRERWRGTMETVGTDIYGVSDAALWELRAENRSELVRYVRERLSMELAARGAAEPPTARAIFDPNALTLGFARRFATYKRPNLLLHDPGRLTRIPPPVLLGFFRSESLFYEPASVAVSGRVGRGRQGLIAEPSASNIFGHHRSKEYPASSRCSRWQLRSCPKGRPGCTNSSSTAIVRSV
jgi:alpha-glucan phosphorylase-like protein